MGIPLDFFVNNKFKWQHLASNSNKLLVQCLTHTASRCYCIFRLF